MIGLSAGAIVSTKLFNKNEKIILKRYITVELSFAILASLSFYIIYNFQTELIEFLTPQSFYKEAIITSFILLPPSFLMGMSFPMLIDIDKNNHRHEKMYGINTIGGAVGVFLFGFIFLKYFGYLNMMFIIPLLSAANILFAYFIFNKKQNKINILKKIESHKIKKSTALLISALSGFTVFLLEVLWFRHLEILIGDRAYISSLILFVIVLTLGLSAYLSGFALKRLKVKKLFGICISLSILSFLISQLFIPEVFYVKKLFNVNFNLKILFIFLSFLIPIFLLGFIYPTILKLIQQNYSDRITALSLGINSIFSMFGTLIGSYVVIESFGVNSIFLISSIILLILLLVVETEYSKKYHFTSSGLLMVLIFIIVGTKKLHIAPENMILHEKQSALTHFTLISNMGRYEMYSGNYRIIFTYGENNVNYSQEALAFAPALYHENPKTMLNMGLGYGITIGSFLHLNPEFIDSVELIPAVVKMSFLFQETNNKQHLNPVVNTYIEDGRRFLARTKKTYDIITANISSPYSIGGSFFLTKEYYQKVKEKLNIDGVYSQLIWGMNNPEIFHTLKSVFPYVSAVPGYDHNEIVILASSMPLKFKKDINTYNQYWSLFNNQPRELSFNLGKQIAKQGLKDKPSFIISDDRADILFQKNSNMGILWTYK